MDEHVRKMFLNSQVIGLVPINLDGSGLIGGCMQCAARPMGVGGVLLGGRMNKKKSAAKKKTSSKNKGMKKPPAMKGKKKK